MVCDEKRKLLEDYRERTQALAIQAELLLDVIENDTEEDWSSGWFRVEQARIACDIARLTLGNHTSSHGC